MAEGDLLAGTTESERLGQCMGIRVGRYNIELFQFWEMGVHRLVEGDKTAIHALKGCYGRQVERLVQEIGGLRHGGIA